MFLDNKGNIIPDKSTLGGMAVGVPGTVAGLYEIYEKMATLPWATLVQPAIDLAEKGFVVTKKQENSLNSKRSDFIKDDKFAYEIWKGIISGEKKRKSPLPRQGLFLLDWPWQVRTCSNSDF